MENKEISVHPYCDSCGKELSLEDIAKNEEFENYEFPICEECFTATIENIKYILK